MSLKVNEIRFFSGKSDVFTLPGLSDPHSQRNKRAIGCSLSTIGSIIKQPALENMRELEKAKSESRQEQSIYLYELG